MSTHSQSKRHTFAYYYNSILQKHSVIRDQKIISYEEQGVQELDILYMATDISNMYSNPVLSNVALSILREWQDNFATFFYNSQEQQIILGTYDSKESDILWFRT